MTQDLTSRIRDASTQCATRAQNNKILPFPIMNIQIYDFFHYLAIKYRKYYYYWIFFHTRSLSLSKLRLEQWEFDTLTLKQFRTKTKSLLPDSDHDYTLENYYLYILPFITEPEKDED